MARTPRAGSVKASLGFSMNFFEPCASGNAADLGILKVYPWPVRYPRNGTRQRTWPAQW
jgi:hypothetical protein